MEEEEEEDNSCSPEEFFKCIEVGESMRKYTRDPLHMKSQQERAEIDYLCCLFDIESGGNGFLMENTGKKERVWSKGLGVWYEREKVKIYDADGRRISIRRALEQTESIADVITGIVPTIDSFDIAYRRPEP